MAGISSTTVYNSASSPMQFGQADTNRMMLLVIAACIPAFLVNSWFFGIGQLINIALAASTAVAAESALLALQQKNIKFYLQDNSALVSAVLFGLAIPPGSSWWLVVMGMLFAIVIAKHAYGGLGQNTFNPAMCGYLFLLLSFPLQMTTWYIPADPLGWQGIQQSLALAFPIFAGSAEPVQGTIAGMPNNLADGLAMATPLIEYKLAAPAALQDAYEESRWYFARNSDTAWELINIAYLLGGLFLLFKRIISWHIPFSIIATILILSSLLYSPGTAAVVGTPYLHLFGSATMIGAFFIATDPVSAATSNRARIIYGIIIGCCIYSIRVWGSYLDSIAIAVLFGNFCAPLLDHLFRPRIYGHGNPRHLLSSKSKEGAGS